MSTVSVVIPYYNSHDTIDRALTSARAQTYPIHEIVIVDDGGAVPAGEYAGVRVIRQKTRGGAAKARNRGIIAATGEYIAFLDSDDEWLPEKLARQMEMISKRPQMNFVCTASSYYDMRGVFHKRLYRGLPPAHGVDAWRTLLAYNFIATPTVVARRSALLRVGGFNPALVIGEDQDLWIRLAIDGELGVVDEPLTIVHDRPTSLSMENAGNELKITFPMILGHVAAQRHRLSSAEVRRIVGSRNAKMARSLYHRNPAVGARLLISAIMNGWHPVENAAYLVRAAPPVQWLKDRLFPLRRRLLATSRPE
jgi:glycosyltransferase involved in cell wall biosynthesis